MSPSNHSQPGQRAPPVSGTGLHDLLLTLFRYKGFMLGCTALGLSAAIGISLVKPPLYVSRAKLLLHYAGGPRDVDPKEIEILTSLDIATQAVASVGVEKVFAQGSGITDSAAAMAIIASGIEGSFTNSPILSIAFKTRRKEITQPVLEAVIHAYMLKHLEVYTGPEILDEYGVRELREKLEHAESDLKQAKLQAGFSPGEQSTPDYAGQITNTQSELEWTTRNLTEKQRVLVSAGSTVGIPDAMLSDYRNKTEQLSKLENEEHDLLWRGYKETHPLVQAVRGQLRKLDADKAGLEKDFPDLNQVAAAAQAASHSPPPANTAEQLADVQRLRVQITALTTSLTNLQAEAARAAQWKPRIAELEHERDRLRSNYDAVVTRLAKAVGSVTPTDNDVIKISIVQNPSPPQLELRQTLQLGLGLLAACVILGLAGAFVLDRIVDRSVNDVADVERRLGSPLFLAIPDAERNGNSASAQNSEKRSTNGSGSARKANHGGAERGGAVRSPAADCLGGYAAGLRERVWTYFETRQLDFKKPKLVGVTGCGRGTGVSTIAGGLAAELSKAGEGSVLLVDVSGDKRASQPFNIGKPGLRVSEVLQPESRSGARVKEGPSVASHDDGSGADAATLRLSSLVPKLKGRDYDYIVFDMPPVSPTSPTPRLANQMDLTLMVLQAERTECGAAARAIELMREARASFGVVLNKCDRKVPQVLLTSEVAAF